MAEIEEPMPPWGPRYEPIDPICHGMGTTDVIDWRWWHVIDLDPYYDTDEQWAHLDYLELLRLS